MARSGLVPTPSPALITWGWVVYVDDSLPHRLTHSLSGAVRRQTEVQSSLTTVSVMAWSQAPSQGERYRVVTMGSWPLEAEGGRCCCPPPCPLTSPLLSTSTPHWPAHSVRHFIRPL